MNQNNINNSNVVYRTPKHEFMFWCAVLFTGILYVFYDDLSVFGRIGKYEEIWWNVCNRASDIDRVAICMANYGIFCITIMFIALFWLWYNLVPVYKKRVFWIPILGLLVFAVLRIIYYFALYIIYTN